MLDKYQISINKTDNNAINTTMQENMSTVSNKNNILKTEKKEHFNKTIK